MDHLVVLGPSLCREEAEYIAHHAVALIGLEQKLSVRGAVENDELLRLRGFLILCANSGEAWSIVARVIAGDDEKAGRLEPISGKIGRVAEKDQAIDGTRRSGNGCVAGGSASHAGSDDRNGFGSVLAEIVDGGQNIEVQGGIGGIGLAGATGLAVAAEIEGQHAKSCGDQGVGLLAPALLVELTTVGEDYGVVSLAIEVREDDAAIFGGKGDGLLRLRGKCDQQAARMATHARIPPMYHRVCRLQPNVDAAGASYGRGIIRPGI